MERSRIYSKGIISDLYFNAEINEKSCIYFYGFPATIGNNSLTHELVKRNITVLQPHYPGTYDSDGDFTPQNSIEMVNSISQTISKNEFVDVKKNKNVCLPKIKYAVADSFGCFIALKSLVFLPNLEKLILFSPAITYGLTDTPSGFIESGPDFLNYVRRSRPFTYRLGSIDSWLEFYSGKLNYKLHDIKNSNLKEVIGVVGKNDASFDMDVLKLNFSKIVINNTNSSVSTRLIFVNNGKHSINSLINDDVDAELNLL
jgi:hypothetical protein